MGFLCFITLETNAISTAIHEMMTIILHQNQQSIKIAILFQQCLERSEAIAEKSIAKTASPNCPFRGNLRPENDWTYPLPLKLGE